LLAAWVFLLGLLQCVRAASFFIRRELLSDLNLSIPLPYAIGSAAVWGGVLLAAAVGLWRLRRGGRWLALGGVTAWQAHTWIDNLVFDRSDYAQQSIGYELGVTLVILAATWGILWWPGVKKRFEN
jgi:hypothetical protein